MISIHKLACAAMFLAVTACSTDPVRVEQDYGNSVRQMIEGQIANPEAARRPSTELPGGLDGARGEKVIEAHRNPPQTGGKSSSAVQIRIGQ
jgi:type IV pilus biogenesis protein CpaD/CtpE